MKSGRRSNMPVDTDAGAPNPMTALWQFTKRVRPDRRRRLLSWTEYDRIVSALLQCTIILYLWESAYSANLPGCHRASFELKVDRDTYDAFFNSPVGYRAEYARSERQGEAANRRLIEALTHSLIAFAVSQGESHLSRVCRSLSASQAKVWIKETEVQNQLTQQFPAITYPAWDFNDPNGQGLRAPRGTRLEVKGGWLDAQFNEVLNPAKGHRSRFIYQTGDSK